MRLFFALFILTVLAMGCTDNGSNASVIKLIVPNGFQGAIKVIQDTEKGVELQTTNGIIVIRVPSTGVYTCKSTKAFSKWHKLDLSYQSGEKLRVGQTGSTNSATMAFYDLWSDTSGTIYYFVGTKTEYDRAVKAGPWKIDDFLPH